MRNLLNFLARFNNLIIFLLLEGIAVYLLANGNSYHNTRIIKGIRGITRNLEEKVSKTKNYLSLREVNSLLAAENAALKNSIERLAGNRQAGSSSFYDSLYFQQFTYTSATIINNSVNRQKNFFTINKGIRQGIGVDMAVISGNNVTGVIVGCSQNYSVAMSVLNPDFRLSARIRSNGNFGSINWDGRDIRFVTLSEIPLHVSINVGDTVETTGYSSVFPEGKMVGTIDSFESSGGDFYRIKVRLMTDFRSIRFVDIVGNLMRREQLELEKIEQ